jgi:hypothetical protein
MDLVVYLAPKLLLLSMLHVSSCRPSVKEGWKPSTLRVGSGAVFFITTSQLLPRLLDRGLSSMSTRLSDLAPSRHY